MIPPDCFSGKVSRPPGAVQTPKIDDLRSVQKSHVKNPCNRTRRSSRCSRVVPGVGNQYSVLVAQGSTRRAPPPAAPAPTTRSKRSACSTQTRLHEANEANDSAEQPVSGRSQPLVFSVQPRPSHLRETCNVAATHWAGRGRRRCRWVGKINRRYIEGDGDRLDDGRADVKP